MNKVIVYTANYGTKDILRCPKDHTGFDFAYFMGDGGVLEAKKLKLLPHLYFKEYDVSLWIDGNIELTGQPVLPIVEEYLKDVNFALLTHPTNCLNLGFNVAFLSKEAQICIDQKKFGWEKIAPQVERYKKEGCPDTLEVPACCILLRRHNAPDVVEFDKLWWEEIQKESTRDQISFPYLAWKTKLKFRIMPCPVWEGWFRYYRH